MIDMNEIQIQEIDKSSAEVFIKEFGYFSMSKIL